MAGFLRGSRFANWESVAFAVFVAIAFSGGARAADVNVAVAANFTDAANEIGALFTEKTGHKAVYSFGSTGQLFTQITQEAPFEVFLSADRSHPAKAVEGGLGVAGSVFTYATGKIVLFSTDASLVTGEDTLKTGTFQKIAIANPETAPYGAAAVEAMKALGVYEALQPKLVQGNNIAQTFQFVETGNAELGFVALSQVAGDDKGSRWIVPENLYSTIAQDVVLLKRGENSEVAKAFVEFLKGPEANAVKEKYGYGTGG
jgi:molybdate transport system substrate-binding protein